MPLHPKAPVGSKVRRFPGRLNTRPLGRQFGLPGVVQWGGSTLANGAERDSSHLLARCASGINPCWVNTELPVCLTERV